MNLEWLEIAILLCSQHSDFGDTCVAMSIDKLLVCVPLLYILNLLNLESEYLLLYHWFRASKTL